jgi:hypothetical protein
VNSQQPKPTLGRPHIQGRGLTRNQLDPDDASHRNTPEQGAQPGLGRGPLAVDQHIARRAAEPAYGLTLLNGEARHLIDQVLRGVGAVTREIGRLENLHFAL